MAWSKESDHYVVIDPQGLPVVVELRDTMGGGMWGATIWINGQFKERIRMGCGTNADRACLFAHHVLGVQWRDMDRLTDWHTALDMAESMGFLVHKVA